MIDYKNVTASNGGRMRTFIDVCFASLLAAGFFVVTWIAMAIF